MTKNEARKLAAHARSIASCMTYNGSATESAAKWRLYELAIDLDTKESEPASIAQSIRNAAINWPQCLGEVECEIISAFCDASSCVWIDWLRFSLEGEWQLDQARTFMLFVAEVLE